MIGDRIGGVLRLVGGAVEGNGGAQTITIAPDASEVWLLRWARGFHNDDGGNRTVEWYIDDQIVATPYRIRDAVSIAANVGHVVYGTDMVGGPLTLEMFGVNVILQTTGVLAGHYLQYTALVEVYSSPIGKNRMLPAP